MTFVGHCFSSHVSAPQPAMNFIPLRYKGKVSRGPSYPPPAPGYPAPAPSYPAPAPSYPAPAPSYPAPAHGYPAPAHGYPPIPSSYPAYLTPAAYYSPLHGFAHGF